VVPVREDLFVALVNSSVSKITPAIGKTTSARIKSKKI
jgi:hypothetical protein